MINAVKGLGLKLYVTARLTHGAHAQFSRGITPNFVTFWLGFAADHR